MKTKRIVLLFAVVFALALLFNVVSLASVVFAEEPVPNTAEQETVTGEAEPFENARSLSAWWKEEVMPLVIAYAIPAVLLLAETLPMLVKVWRASGRFDRSATQVNEVVEATEKYKEAIETEKAASKAELQAFLEASEERVKSYEENLLTKQMEYQELMLTQQDAVKQVLTEVLEIASGYREALSATETRLASVLSTVEKRAGKTERMVYLGLTNSGELVQNGAARKIAKVEESDDEG